MMRRGVLSPLAVVLLVLAAMAPAMAGAPLRAQAEAEAHDRTTGPEPHPSILIQGDAGFQAPLSGVRRGEGTAADPYVISGWMLTQHRAAGLRLVDTRAHVVVEDVYVGGREAGPGNLVDCELDRTTCTLAQGIHLYNATNVTLRNVRVASGFEGIEIRRSADVRIEDAALATGDPSLALLETGLVVLESRRVQVVNVTVGNVVVTPLRIGFSDDVVVTDSVFQGAGEATAISGVRNLTLARVKVVNTPLLLSSYVEGFSLIGSDVVDGSDGIVFFGSAGPVDGLRVCGNRFQNLQGANAAIYVEQFTNVSIEHNLFLDNTAGVDLILPGGASITGNVFRGQSVYHANLVSPSATVRGNVFAHDSPGGVRLDGALIDATLNWWDDATGPSGAGSGSGAHLEIVTPGTLYSPWLASEPAHAPSCPHVDVGAPGTHAPFTLEAKGELRVKAQVKVDVGPVKVNRTEERVLPFGTGPLLLP